jgi:POT family proton-dependent oligopeptide transporter
MESRGKEFFGHPPGLSTLFFTELWERFGYYGMRALLILYLASAASSGGFGLDESAAYGIYGLYTGMVYLVSLPGGWIADRILGQQRAVLYGGILIAIGYLMLAVPDRAVFFSGMAVVVAGTGLLKPNVSTIVGQIYAPGDPRRDSGFSIFYMGINIGAMVAPLVCGYIGQRINWQLGFATAGVGMVLGVITFLAGRRRLGEAGLHPVTHGDPAEYHRSRRLLLRGSAAAAAFGIGLYAVRAAGLYTVTVQTMVNLAGLLMFTIVIGMFGWMFLGGEWSAPERKRLAVIFVLFLASALFWSAFEQAGSSLNLFAQRNTDTSLLGFDFPASWLQSLNATFIIVFAAVFAWLWLRMGERQPSSPAKFALGLILVGLGFVVMMTAADRAAEGVRVSPLWLVVTYLLHTLGELCLSPVGLSAMTTLAPARVAGLMMGVWFVSIAAGNYIGGRLAALYGDLPVRDLFQTIALFAIAAGLLLAVIARPVARLAGKP